LQFTKYQGAGNDYLFIDGREHQHDWPELARRMSDRHFGVGADGLIIAVRSTRAPIRMRIFNADGSESEMCGNGIRCFSKFVLEHEIVPSTRGPLEIETKSGVLTVVPHWMAERVTSAMVDMGAPVLRARDVPVDPSAAGASNLVQLNAPLVEELGLSPSDLLFDVPIQVDGTSFTGTAVSMGNPHFVSFLDTPVSEVGLERQGLGSLVEHHAAFPQRINFHIVNVVDRTHLLSRTWERGSGITLACGTGASAMVVAARLHGLVDDDVIVTLPGGDLTITWPGYGPVFMEGDAVEVFSGEFPD
jgi:diaminopimelate epimerase